MSPVCGASWAKTEDICYKLITVADAELAEVTQAANEVDYATAKVILLFSKLSINQTLNYQGQIQLVWKLSIIQT